MDVECIGNTQIIHMEETGITQQTIGLLSLALWRKILPPDLKTLVYFFLLTLYFGATIGQ